MKKAVAVVSAGVSFIKGAASGNVDVMLQGLASGLGAAGSLAGGDGGEALGAIGQGIASANHLAHGRHQKALQGAAGALSPLGQIPATKGAMKYIKAGFGVANAIAKGKYPNAAKAFTKALAPLAEKDPTMKRILAYAGPAVQIASSVASGKADKAVQGAFAGLHRAIQSP